MLMCHEVHVMATVVTSDWFQIFRLNVSLFRR